MGTGNFGTVKKAIHKQTGAERAVKIVPKFRVKDKARLAMEIKILRAVVRKLWKG